MGIYDRDYVKDEPRRGGGGYGGGGPARARFGAPSAWSVTTWLIVINVLIHVLAVTVFVWELPPDRRSVFPVMSPSGPPSYLVLHEYGHFSTAKGFFEIVQRLDASGQVVNAVQLNLQVWRLLTFQFLHDPNSILHLFFNMFGLWIFGPMVEETLGRRKYLAFYLVCGIMGGVMYVFLNLLGMTGLPLPGVLTTPPTTPLVGASAGVFGVIMACAYVAPNTIVQLVFAPISLKMKWLAYGYVGISLFNLLISGRNAGGDAAHVGGAIAGYFFIRNPHHLLDFFDILGNSNAPKSARGGRAGRSGRKSGPRAPSQDEVDRILDKVNLKGIQSLTAKEKKVLERASRGGKG